jgi:hypothetical protein
MNLEDEIRAALQRHEPPPDFTARVLAHAAARPRMRGRRPWTRWVAAMAASVLLAAGAAEYRHYRGEQAKAQVMLAVKIAGAKLNKAHKRILMLHAAHRSNS